MATESKPMGKGISTTDLVNTVYGFCAILTGIKLYPYQEQYSKRVIRSVLTNDSAEITALFSRQCIPAGQKVYMSDGTYKFIEDVRQGDSILSVDVSNKSVDVDYVVDSWSTGIRERLKIKTLRGFEIECSQKHLFLTPQGWRESESLQYQETIATLKRSDVSWDVIISIETLEPVEMYDVETKEHHNFVCNGFVVHNSGKSEAISVTVSGLMVILPTFANLPMFALDKRLAMFRKGFWVGIFAPSQRQAQITFGRIKNRLQSKEAVKVLQELGLTFSTSNGQTVSLTNGSFVTSISASEQSNIEGESFMLLIAEEAQDIANSVMSKSISPMGAAYNATFCKIGTATTYRGNFYYAIERNKKDFERKKAAGWTGIIRNHFEYDCDVAAKYNPKYHKYIEREKKILGEKSDAFRMSYRLEWIFQRGMFVELYEFLAKCGDMFMERVHGDLRAVHVAGIDIGGSSKHGDPDSTVITVGEVDWNSPVVFETRTDPHTNEETTFAGFNTYIKDWHEITSPDYEVQYGEIVAYLKKFNVRRAVVDATRETSIAHRLRANMPFEVLPYVFNGKSKSDLYKHLEREINSGRLRVPLGEYTIKTREFDRFVTQMEDLQKDYRGALLQVSHPPGRGHHDDYPDSLALCVFGTGYEGEVYAATTHDTRKVFERGRYRTKTKNALTAKRKRRF